MSHLTSCTATSTLSYTLPVRFPLLSANLPFADSSHSMFQISYKFSNAYVFPKNPSKSEALVTLR